MTGTTRKGQKRRGKEEKKAAAFEYAACGSANKTAKLLGMPRKTLDGWIEGDEDFNEFYEIAISVRNRIYAGQCGALFEKVLTALDDRVTHGDHVTIKGEIVRRPMNGRELAISAGILFDKNRIGNMQPARYTEGTKGLEETLKKTQEALEKFAGKTDVGKKTNATILKIVENNG